MSFHMNAQVETQSKALNYDVHDMIAALHVQIEIEYVNGHVAGFPPTHITM